MIRENLNQILNQLPTSVKLIAVSKTKPVSDILEAYSAGQRMFGENKAQEMAAKYQQLPKDIEWHMIGHLQRNKVKYIAHFVNLIHSVDSLNLLETIDKEAQKNNRKIDFLLQMYIATEETKFGLNNTELDEICQALVKGMFKSVNLRGLMGMASFTENETLIRQEFRQLKSLFDNLKNNVFSQKPDFEILSMGMSGDYKIAIEEGSNMIRIGSNIFGERVYNTTSSEDKE